MAEFLVKLSKIPKIPKKTNYLISKELQEILPDVYFLSNLKKNGTNLLGKASSSAKGQKMQILKLGCGVGGGSQCQKTFFLILIAPLLDPTLNFHFFSIFY